MEFKKAITHLINGVYGDVEYTDLNLNSKYYPSRYNSEEWDIDTNDLISYIDETNGLPEGIDMDTYFKMALLKRLDNIEKKLNKLQNINVSVDISDEVIEKLAKAIKGDKNKK